MTVKKNPALIAFFKLLLGNVKVDILWIFWEFFWEFWMRPLQRPIIDVLIFLEMKGVEVVHISGKFHLNLACGSWVFSMQMFLAVESRHNNNPNLSLFPSWRIKIY